jgi:hypothetical protein
MNLIAILGPSRGGKAALTPYLSASREVDLPFNTPDLDWLIDSHNKGHVTDEGFLHHVSIYLLTYSWYSFLGRHINLRTSDYYCAKNLKPHINITERFLRPDNDETFGEFLALVESKAWVPCFQLDFTLRQFKMLVEASDINYQPLYSRRSPFDLLRSWLVGNRLDRSKSLSRMMKYGSVPARSNVPFAAQFQPVLGVKESTVDNKGIFTFHNLSSDKFDRNTDNINSLIEMVIAEAACGTEWENAGNAIRFEEMVSAPEKVQSLLNDRLGIEFCDDLLPRAYEFIKLRPLEEALTTDLKLIEKELKELSVEEEKIQQIIHLQSVYIGHFGG